MFWKKKKSIPKEIEFDAEIDEIKIDLLAGDLPSYLERLRPMIDSLNKDDKFGLSERVFFTAGANFGQTKEIMDLWNTLESGEPMRCYSPGHRLKFYSRGNFVRSASLCWECNKIKFIDSEGNEDWFNFEGTTVNAEKLLVKCRELMNAKI